MKALLITILAAFQFFNVSAQSKIVKENRQVGVFTSINASSGWDVIVRQGDRQSVSVEATKEVLDNTVVEVKNSTLYVYSKKNIQFFNIRNLQKNIPRKVYVTVKDLQKVDASGGVDVLFETPIKAENFEINLSGGSDLKQLSLECNRFEGQFSGGCDAAVRFNRVQSIKVNTSGGSDVDLKDISAQTTWISASGGCDIDLTGKTDILTLHGSGGSDVSASQLITRKGELDFSGGSDGKVCVTDQLEVTLSGAADVTCSGNPKQVNKKVDKSSSLRII